MRRCIALLLVLVLLLLSACGQEGQASLPESGGGSSPASEPAAQPETPPDSQPESQRNETVEALLREYNNPPKGGPSLADAKPTGMNLYFPDGTVTDVPIPSTSPGYSQKHAVSLRDDAVVIAYDPEDGSDTVAVVSTRDQGQSWQTASVNAGEAGKIGGCYFLAFQDGEKGILVLCERDKDGGPIFSLKDTDPIYATEDAGMSWSSSMFLPAMDEIQAVTAAEGCYCIAGEIDTRPVVLKSGDGKNWEELTLPLDAGEYTEGYCKYAAFSGDTGLAVVIGTNTAGKSDWLYLFSQDGGQSWSPYQ